MRVNTKLFGGNSPQEIVLIKSVINAKMGILFYMRIDKNMNTTSCDILSVGV